MTDAQDSRPHTAVLHQFTGIGDLIWHVEYFKAVARQSRGGKVVVIAQPSTKAQAILGHEPWVEAVLDHDHRPRRSDNHRRAGQHSGLAGMWRMARQLRGYQFDRIVLFSGRISRGLLAAMAGIPQRLGYGYNPLQRLCLTHGPYIARYRGTSVAVLKEASAFAVAHGFCQAPLRPRLDVPATELADMAARLVSLPPRRIALAVGTSEAHKQWGADKFAALARHLLERGHGVILLGGPSEEALIDDIQAQLPASLLPHAIGISRASILGSAAVLSLCDACVGNDTGMVNLAAAVGRPTLVLLGARPTLDHDPLIVSLTAPSLEALTVRAVCEALPASVPSLAAEPGHRHPTTILTKGTT